MATTQERLQILKMIEQGKISASEGSELLRALEQTERGKPKEPLKGASAPRWFRVRVTDVKSGRNKVNVNIPLGLVNIGIKMGARFVPDLEGVNYEQIREAIESGRTGKVFDFVDNDSGEQIEIFME
ncbi:MAG: hypothetical protein Fur0021_27480 [Candidatus Promineifilaceae bacterium]